MQWLLEVFDASALVRVLLFQQCWFCTISADIGPGNPATNGLEDYESSFDLVEPLKGSQGTRRFAGRALDC